MANYEIFSHVDCVRPLTRYIQCFAFPIGLLVFSLICNLIYMLGSRQPVWGTLALYTMGGGIIGAALATLPGFIDFLLIHDAETKSLAWKHIFANVTGLVVFVVAFSLQYQKGSPSPSAVLLSHLGVLSIAVGGWLGGGLVYVNCMAVERVDKLEKQQARTTEPHRSGVRRAS
jgi:uncharacterized membrane protein